MEKKEALSQISDLTNQITKLVKQAQKLADNNGISFYLDLNGTGGTYYGKGTPQPPSEDDFPNTPDGDLAYELAYEKWEDESGGSSHPYGEDGWVNSSFDC